ncbi:MAG: NAD(+)/NADH kinase [Syntrophomonadaceae bacterium]
MIVNNKRLSSTMVMGDKVAAALRSMGIEVLIDSSSADITSESFEAIIVLGGDGTMIRTARQYADRNVPVLGVNMGTVGFLSNIRADEFDRYVQRFAAGDFSLEERMLLEISVYRESSLADRLLSLNEVSIKSKAARIISLEVTVEGRQHGLYRGDGLIVATPSGSTAYSLSCGGPIIDPVLDVFVLTPITSYQLNRRPLVVAANKEIEIKPRDGEQYYISVDGQVSIDITADCSVHIRKAHHRLRMAIMKPRFFFESIVERLQRDQNG